MRIWVQSNTDLKVNKVWEPYLDVLTDHLEAAKSSDTELKLEGVDKMEPDVTRSPYRRYRNTQQLIDKGLEAQADGWDAFVVIGLATMGRQELLDALEIPVIYAQDVAWSFAMWLYGRFGLLAHSRSVYMRRTQQIATSGASGAFVPGSYCEYTEHDVVEAFVTDNGVLDDLIESAGQAVQGGAEVLIPDINPVAMLLEKHGIREAANRPVFDTATWTVRAAELCVHSGEAPAKPSW